MKKINNKIIASLLLVTCYLLLVTAPSAQASALSLSLDPPIIEISAIPPTNATSNLTIQNKSDSEVILKIQFKPFKSRLENGELEFLDFRDYFIENNTQILDNGISVEGITLGPRQKKDLTLNINIPQDANISRPTSPADELAGGRADHYFSIIFISENESSPNSTTSLNQLGIASNVLLSVGAKEIPDATLEEFSTKLFYESGPVPFTIRIKNMGVHFIKPRGEILIKNMFGQIIGKLDLKSVNILSDSIRAITNAVWKEDFLLGFYTATLNLALSSDGPSFTKSIYFFAFPFHGLILIVISLIAIIITKNKIKSRMEKVRT